MERDNTNNSEFTHDNGNATIATNSQPGDGDVATEYVVQTTPSLDDTGEDMCHHLLILLTIDYRKDFYNMVPS